MIDFIDRAYTSCGIGINGDGNLDRIKTKAQLLHLDLGSTVSEHERRKRRE